MKIWLAFVCLGLACAIAGGRYGYNTASDPTHCASIIAEEMKAKSDLKRAIASSMAEAERDDFLTDMCKDDPKQCDNGKAVIQPVKK